MSGSDSSTSSVSVESMEDGNSTLNDENFEQELTILQRLQENEVLCSVILQEGLSIDRKNKEFLYENNNYLGFAEVFTNSECPYDYLDAARKICTKLIEQGFSVIKFPCL